MTENSGAVAQAASRVSRLTGLFARWVVAIVSAIALAAPVVVSPPPAFSEGEVIPVTVFNMPGMNGTAGGFECGNENSNLLSIIDALPGYSVDGQIVSFGGTTWTGSGSKPEGATTAFFQERLEASRFFVMPDMENTNPADEGFYPSAARDIMRDWVTRGNVLVITGMANAGANTMLNVTFRNQANESWNIGRAGSSPWAQVTENTTGTPFELNIPSLAYENATDSFNFTGSRVDSVRVMWGTESNAVVAVIPVGNGYVIWIGFDFYDSGAPGVAGVSTYANDGRRVEGTAQCSQYTGDWARQVLPAALRYATQLADEAKAPAADAPAVVVGEPRIGFDVRASVGRPVEGIPVDLLALDMPQGSTARVTLYQPENRLFDQPLATRSLNETLRLPGGLPAGVYSLVYTVTLPSGEVLALNRSFEVSAEGLLVSLGENAVGLGSAVTPEPQRLAYTGLRSNSLPWWALVSLAFGLVLVLYSIRALRMVEQMAIAMEPPREKTPWEILQTPIRVPGIDYQPGTSSSEVGAQSLSEAIHDLDIALSRLVARRLSWVSPRYSHLSGV